MIEWKQTAVEHIALGSDFHLGGNPSGKDPISIDVFKRELHELPHLGVVAVLLGGDIFHFKDEKGNAIYEVEQALKDLNAHILWINGNHEEVSQQNNEITRMVSSLQNCKVLNNAGVVLDVNGLRIAVAGTTGVGGGFGSSMFFSSPDRERVYEEEAARTKTEFQQAISELEDKDVDMLLAFSHYPLLIPIRGELGNIKPSEHPSELGDLVINSLIPSKQFANGHFHSDVAPHFIEGYPALNTSATLNLEREGTLFTLRTPLMSIDGVVFLEKPEVAESSTHFVLPLLGQA